MSDDIVEGLRRAGSDDGMPLGFGAADVLRMGRSRRRRRRVYGGSATALSVAMVATTAWAVLPASVEDRSEPALPVGEPDTVPLDRGPMSSEEIEDWLVSCPGQTDDQNTIYARKVDSMGGTHPALLVVVPRPNGEMTTCEANGWDGHSPVVTRTPDSTHPIVSIASAGFRTSEAGGWQTGGFFRVADSVARVETRVGTQGGSEPWRVSKPFNGVVFWSAWLEAGAYDDDDEIWLRWRAYDTDGNRIDPALLPDQPQLIDPTGSNQVAAEYDEVRGLIDGVAHDHLETERGSLEGGSPRHGSRDDGGWTSVTTDLFWSPLRSMESLVVELSLSRPGTYSDDELRARIGCGHWFECRRVDLGDQGWAWVGEDDAGRIGVGHVQPDGEIAYVVIGADHPYFENMDGESDLTVDHAIGFVTDDRLDLP